MGFERFDPAAFLAGLRKNEISEAPPAKVAKAAKVVGGGEPTLATVATLAGGGPQNEKSEGTQPLAGLATLAGGTRENEKSGRIHQPAPPEPFEHHCEVCGEWGAFGYGVSLQRGRAGKWFCFAHRPSQSISQSKPAELLKGKCT
jgi:hypothetical protein